MNIDDIRGSIEMVIKDLFRDHRSGDDLPLMPHEIFQKRIFLGREFDFDIFPKNSVPLRF
jgi:hypothetical protein